MTLLASLDDAALDDLELASDAEIDGLLVAIRAELTQLEREWTLQPRQQRAEDLIAETDVFELLYGGAAAGGKSEWLLYHFYNLAKQFPKFHGLILRRTFPELRRSLIMRSWERFDPELARYHTSEHIWRFKNGSTIEFGYCVERDTPILMADGSYCPMHQIRVGDAVMTMEGPRRVTAHWRVGEKSAVEITTERATVVASSSHRILAANGAWRPPVLPAGPGDCRTTTDATRRGTGPHLAAWGMHAGLYVPPRASESWAALSSERRDARPRVARGSAPRGSSDGYPTGTRSGDARVRRAAAAVRAHIRQRVGAGTRGPTILRADGPARTPIRSRPPVSSYCHPYTMEDRPLVGSVRPAFAAIAPAGDRELWDMTVEGANHYVSLGGIVHQNCEVDKDVYQYQSAEYDAIGWDELTQFPTDFPYTYLMSRCRTTIDKRARGLRPHVVAGTNPGGVGGVWVKDRFIDVGPPEKIHYAETFVRGEARVVQRVFVPAKISDNAYIGDEYALALANLDPATRAALEDGSWDVVEGQYFTDWDREIHVCDPFVIPKHWPRIGGLDYGYRAPMCHLWGAIDGDGDVWIYRELYRTGMTPTEQAKKIQAMSVYQGPGVTGPERLDYIVADPSIWSNTGVGMPIAQQYRDAGLPTRRANNARIDGWQRVRDYLRVDPKTKTAQLHVFANCTNLIRTLPMLVHDDVRPEDLNTKGEDHAADALRYLLMSRPRKARGPESTTPKGPDQEYWDRVRSRRRTKRQKGRDGSPVGRIV